MMQDKQLLDEFHALPSDKQAEVIDFIQRLKAKQTNTVIQTDASDPIFMFGKNPVSDDLTDASENHDVYLYHS
ncbi:hypothetical protein COW36_07830 [bacterium (Candidatus Blackallbacteria) CG17_big_fil_post_rev_8_21_14_2_50_48_46]|uniref:DUF2281 domain-containing protein n=1 Tax=bacterium (Candidatus Blackallbacteria) CG17_big_fil_post_rev_8_21_14_2_50_48_46 TaxID=2014261 RepID=A0A2M7G6I9_9BACT|nr:MAG: hypothetical protein COW64_23190 [bacterium (Candidatus Blackallbacteria) CG18_big_fil_WC_8_21_14_2_50_49_26]PIW17644.1 MAG: hypothetical protein COW36_07830 [bacterium (Candidatus Blackallbacteria) CG17_big_fil_post_rev_8_21_14_2_50_48_46]PIW49305.1 MAG: hypothetical protein COW20_06350 [bacterium (Candidatus Blackallbacteria) CG13_big_fil_rev_8_21_14_2_50_49_14]